MAFRTTSIDLTTAPVQIFGSTNAWANNANARVDDPVPFSMYVSGPAIRIGGSASTAQTGFPLASSATFSNDFRAPEALFAFTSASTGSVVVFAGRQ